MSSPLDLIVGTQRLLVGVEVDPVEVDDDGSPLVRLYIDSRGLNRYVLVGGDDGQRALDEWKAFGQHLMIPTPPSDRIYQDEGTS